MNRIKYLRESIRMTQKELGDRIGQTSSNISKYETGLLEPNIKTLSAMAVFFNASIDFIVGLSDDPTRRKKADNENSTNDYFVLQDDDGMCETIIIPKEKSKRFRNLIISAFPEFEDYMRWRKLHVTYE